MTVTDIGSRTLDLETLEPDEIVHITIVNDERLIAGRLLLTPKDEERVRQLQLGLVEDGQIRWVVGLELIKLGSVSLNGGEFTAVASLEVTTDVPLHAHLYERPTSPTRQIGIVKDYDVFRPH